MDTHVATEAVQPRRSLRALAVTAIGPLTVLVGVAWALVQPNRITLLHPRGQGFWSLAVEPPLLVALVGLVFWLRVVPGLVEDLESDEAER